jgi:Tol biopolymer transport system component
MTLTPGTRLGPYEIVAPLGAGGMGEVYRARDTRLGRDVAVKVLPSSVAIDPDRRARFEREAKSVAALSHPNILAIFDFALHDGVACAVTELLEGETLRATLSQGPLSVRRAIDTAIQIGRGLAAAHDKGIVHRDLKPENVFLLSDGQVKILDFGLAKAVAEGAGSENATVAATDPGTVMGTVGYMAPEQVRGQTVDARADLFALGAVLYEMLSGRQAFHRETAAETMTAILKEDAPELTAGRADLPETLGTIVRHCLERNPAERFQSARDLVFNLQSLAHTAGSGSAAAVKAVGPRARLAWREGLAWALVAALAIGVGVLIQRSTAARPSAVVRLQVTAPAQTTWASPLGAPDGSNGGTISPDGTMLAFAAADASGKALLWVRRVDSFTARALPDTDGAAFPFWSPDSRSIGFFTTTKLKKISAEGGAAQTLCEIPTTPRGGSWSERGVILIGTSGSAIRRTTIDGGAPVPVTGLDAQNAGQQWPSFLPDGRHFLFYSASTRAVFVGSLDSPATTRLVASDSNATYAPPGMILFVREGSLLAQGFDVGRLEMKGEAHPIAERVAWAVAPWNLAAFSVSRTGTLTYRLGGGSRTQFAWFDRAGRELATVGPPGDYLAPALSPDETRLAYGRRDDQPAGDIWTLDLGRQTPLRFTFSPDTDVYPVWTSDGSTIIHSSVREGLLARPLGGTAPAKQLFAPTMSMLIPTQVIDNDRVLVFFGDMGTATGFDIFTNPLSGGTPTAVVQGPLTDAEPDVSPDGRWIAYATTETGNYEVFVQPLPPTGAKWQVSTGGGRQPRWRRDGRELYFVTNDRKFYVVDVRAGATFEFGTPGKLFDMPSNTVSVRNSYEPSKDGQRFLVNKLLDTAMPPINVVVNWATTMEK